MYERDRNKQRGITVLSISKKRKEKGEKKGKNRISNIFTTMERGKKKKKEEEKGGERLDDCCVNILHNADSALGGVFIATGGGKETFYFSNKQGEKEGKKTVRTLGPVASAS